MMKRTVPRLFPARLLLGLMLAFQVSCGLVGEPEAPPATERLETAGSACRPAKMEKLVRADRTTLGSVRSSVGCIRSQVLDGLKFLRGDIQGEVSIGELRQLVRSGSLKLPGGLTDSDELWQVVGGMLSLLHPEGRHALSARTVERLFGWLDRHSPLYLDLLQASEHYRGRRFDGQLVQRLITAGEEFAGILSAQGKLELHEVQSLVDVAAEHLGITAPDKVREVKDGLAGVWNLKALVFPDNENDGLGAPLRSTGLRELLLLGARLARQLDRTIGWLIAGSLPRELTEAVIEEWEPAARLGIEYFDRNRFAAIDVDLLRWSLARLASGQTSEFAPDLVRISQRLIGEGAAAGLHARVFKGFLRQAGGIGMDLLRASKAFAHCNQVRDCAVTLRTALKHDVLKRVALKGRLGRWWSEDGILRKRLDQSIEWEDAYSRLIERALIGKVFQAFDLNGDGKIDLDGTTSTETAEAMDLAYTFLRMVAIDSASPGRDRKKEQSVPIPAPLRPGALYRVFGLVGDRWMPDGNFDQALDSDEFFSVVKIYQAIQDLTQEIAYELLYRAPSYWTESVEDEWGLPGGPLHSRFDLLSALPLALRPFLPWSVQELERLPAPQRLSLFHALTGVPDRPLNVYLIRKPYGWIRPIPEPQPFLLRYPMKGNAALAPVAVLMLLDRLMIRCDLNEDDRLSWSELDCAMPLVLSAALETVKSGLVEVDPGVNDGSRLALELLQTQGVPLSAAKLIAINGAVREFHPERGWEGLIEWLEHDSMVALDDLAQMFGAPEGPRRRAWVVEAGIRFGECDAGGDGWFAGAELNCVAVTALEGMAGSLPELPRKVLRSWLEGLSDSAMARAAVKLSAQRPDVLGEKLSHVEGFQSSVGKLLQVIEEVIRRSKPLCQLPQC